MTGIDSVKFGAFLEVPNVTSELKTREPELELWNGCRLNRKPFRHFNMS